MMKNNLNLFSMLQVCRYSLTAAHNGTQVTPYCTGQASSTWELTMNITYEELCPRLQAHFGINGNLDGMTTDKSSLQQYRNHLSTLNSFLASVGKTLDARIGAEMGSAFETTLKSYLHLIDVAPRTKRDRNNHLKLIRRIYEALQNPSRATNRATSFGAELRAQVARTGLAPKTLARTVGLSTSAMQRWLKGALPNRRGLATVRRLETALSLPRDHLVALIKEESPAPAAKAQNIPYRHGLAARTSDFYMLSESAISPELSLQWRDWFTHKTTASPELERASRGEWRCVPLQTLGRISKLAQRGSTGCPTAGIVLERLRQFIGFLSLSEERGGWGLDADKAQTIAWFAVPDAVEAFLNFMSERSGGLMHHGHRTLCQIVASLVREKYGYLWQRPELATTLCAPYKPCDTAAWHKLCARTHKLVSACKRKSREISRRPAEPIAHLLDLDEPLSPILDAIAAIESAGASTPTGSMREAHHGRDACLLALLLSNPLRVRNWQAMTWRPDNTGALYCAADGSWRIRLAGHELKNGAAESASCYDVAVAGWVVPKLTAYLEEYRPTLLRANKSDYLFISCRSPGFWEGMPQRVAQLTRRFVEGSPGIRPHAFRHLIATDFLRHNPNAFALVAELLNDELATVMKSYAHLRRETSFAHHDAHIAGLLGNSKDRTK